MHVTQWLDRYQRRHRWAGFPVAVIYKFFEDQGPYLAALITFYGFLSLFPLLLLLASVLGFVLEDNPDLEERILDSALSQFPVIGDQLNDPQGLQGSGIALVVGGLVALYGALGVAQAFQNAMNVAWSVPRNRRPNPAQARLRSLLLVGTAGIAVGATTILSALGTSVADGAVLPGWRAVVTVAAIVLNAAVFVVAFRIATATRLSTRDAAPGAVVAAVVWQLLQLFGTAYVTGVVQDAGPAYGVFAVVLGLLGWIFLAALGVVLSVEVNVVRAKRLYPRALLTPFTDNVDLTHADQRAYTDAATAQRHKGFQVVHVTFDDEGQQASARRRPDTGTNGGETVGGDDPAPGHVLGSEPAAAAPPDRIPSRPASRETFIGEETKTVVRRFAEECWDGGDFSVADELVADDVRRNGQPIGRAGLIAVIAAIRSAFPDFHTEIEELIADGDRVAWRYSSAGSHAGESLLGIPASGRAVSWTGTAILRVDGGQITEIWDNVDLLAISTQLGAVSPPGAASTSPSG